MPRTDANGWWLPAGRVHEGETLQDAAIRKCREVSDPHFISKTALLVLSPLTELRRVTYLFCSIHVFIV